MRLYLPTLQFGVSHLVTDTTWKFKSYSYIIDVVKVCPSNLLAPMEELY